MNKVLNGEGDDDKNKKNRKENLDLDMNFMPPLREAAITLHVMYNELKDAGFSRRDALQLISSVMIFSLFGPIDEK